MIDEQVFGSLDLGFLPEQTSATTPLPAGPGGPAGGQRALGQHSLRQAGREGSARPAAPSSPCWSPGCGDAEGGRRRGDDRRLPRALQGREAHLRGAQRGARWRWPACATSRRTTRARSRPTSWCSCPSWTRAAPRCTWRRRGPGTSWASCAAPWACSPPWTRRRFRDEFLPDKYLLRALIYRDLCHYLPAKRAAKELTRRFADSLEAIRERDDLTQDLRLRRAAEQPRLDQARRAASWTR